MYKPRKLGTHNKERAMQLGMEQDRVGVAIESSDPVQSRTFRIEASVTVNAALIHWIRSTNKIPKLGKPLRRLQKNKRIPSHMPCR